MTSRCRPGVGYGRSVPRGQVCVYPDLKRETNNNLISFAAPRAVRRCAFSYSWLPPPSSPNGMMGSPGIALCHPSPVPGTTAVALAPAVRPTNQTRAAIIRIADSFLILDHLAN